MILYLGSSSLIKLYVEEEYSDIARKWAHEAEVVATCRITYTEVISALEIRLTKGDITPDDYGIVIKHFSKDWSEYAVIDFDDRQAAFYVTRYGLYQFDALHLSSAKLIQKKQNGFFLVFSSANEKLCRAAEAEGLTVIRFR